MPIPARRIGWRTVGGGSLPGRHAPRARAAVRTDAPSAGPGEMGFRGPLRLLEPLIAAEARAGEARELERLRSLLEQPPTG